MRIRGTSNREFKAPKPPEKAYCGRCRFYDGSKQCNHKSVVSHYDTPILPMTNYGDCMELNKENNCPNYQRKM